MAIETNKNTTSTPAVGVNTTLKCRVVNTDGNKVLINFKGYRVSLATKKKYKQNDIVTISYNNKEIKIIE